MSVAGASPIDPVSVDMVTFPNVASVNWHNATVGPGDAIYIPMSWLHYVDTVPGRSVALTLWFKFGPETMGGADIDPDQGSSLTQQLVTFQRHRSLLPDTLGCDKPLPNTTTINAAEWPDDTAAEFM
mmetsp:Transcript_14783/g.34745  ORF Transcript_14783/g.34745 Transcript_14783/m.34745 type:complete len:127 (-) Transcript_14783:98-478(-)